MKINKDYIAMFAFYFTVIILLIFFFSSCTTAKKATRFMNENEAIAAKFCAEKFPLDTVTIIRDSLHTDTVTIEQPPQYDTLYLDGKPVVIHRKCPPSKTITQVKYQTIERVVENTAKVAVCDNEKQALQKEKEAAETTLAKTKEEVNEAKKDRSRWRLLCLITWAIVGIYIVLKAKRILSF